jgi:aspartate/tyrosine/aromatic aminotransferase
MLQIYREMSGGIIATFRAGGCEAEEATERLVQSVRDTYSMPQLAAAIRNEVCAVPSVQTSYQQIVDSFNEISVRLPSPDQYSLAHPHTLEQNSR